MQQSTAVIRNRHFWAILILLIGFGILHYVEQIGITGTGAPSAHFGLSRHSLDRILFLIPIIYSGYVFGLFAGLFTSFAALLIMLPRVIVVSPAPADAVLETCGIITVGTVMCLWLSTRAKEKAKTEAALQKLESTHRTLQHYVQSMRRNERQLTILNSISTILMGSLELEGLLRKATTMVSELMEVEITLLFHLDEDTQELRLVGHAGISDEFVRAVEVCRIGKGLYGEVAATGQPQIVEDLSLDSKLTGPEFKKMQIRVQLIIPLILREQVSGVVCVAMRRPRQFSADDIELLTAVGSQIAIAVENARLYEKERLTAQRLTISEKNYRRLFENANDAIWTHDLEGNITVANKACEKLTGYNMDELIKMNANSFLSAGSLEKASEVRRRLFEKEPVEQPYEQHIVRSDGTEATLMLTTSLLIEDGKPIGFQHIARDMTKEKWMQDNLRYYLQEITSAQEDERKRIARELHDDTAQDLYALNRQVDNFVRSNSDLPADTGNFLTGLGKHIKKVLRGVRQFSQDLRPSMLDDLGLVATLRWLVNEINLLNGIKVSLTVSGTEQRLPPNIELLLFRIIQEALRNTEKHSNASEADIFIRFEDDKLAATVRDNGRGFDFPERIGDLSRAGKLGLVGIEERARLLGGQLKIQSEKGKGTSVEIEVPLQL